MSRFKCFFTESVCGPNNSARTRMTGMQKKEIINNKKRRKKQKKEKYMLGSTYSACTRKTENEQTLSKKS